MQTTFILRLLDKDRQVLGWTRIVGETRGDGAVYATQDFVAEADVTGTATALNVHWPELHWHDTTTLPGAMSVEQGKVFTVRIKDQTLLRVASESLPLPAVTVRSSVDIRIPMARSA